MISNWAMDDGDTIPTLDDICLDAIRAEAFAPLTSVADWGGATTRGAVRLENEDAWGHLSDDLFVVADGMGGYAGGGLAARTAVAGLLSTAASRGIADWPAAIDRLNDQVRAASRARGHRRAGTALVAVSLVAGVATVVNLGDSRAYRLRTGRLLRLTEDHTVGAELLASGVDPDELERRGTALNALTRHLGGGTDCVVPDVTSLVPLDGDRLLLVTDGVFRQVGRADIVETMASRSCGDAARRLVDLADEAGGHDNATAVVLRMASEVS